MKVLLITQDSCTRLNTIAGEVIEAFRPSVVTITEFVNSLVMKRLVKPVGFELPDTATDVEFEKFFIDSDKNVDLAIDSYLSKISQETRSGDEPESEGRFLPEREGIAHLADLEKQVKEDAARADEKAKADAAAAAEAKAKEDADKAKADPVKAANAAASAPAATGTNAKVVGQ